MRPGRALGPTLQGQLGLAAAPRRRGARGGGRQQARAATRPRPRGSAQGAMAARAAMAGGGGGGAGAGGRERGTGLAGKISQVPERVPALKPENGGKGGVARFWRHGILLPGTWGGNTRLGIAMEGGGRQAAEQEGEEEKTPRAGKKTPCQRGDSA